MAFYKLWKTVSFSVLGSILAYFLFVYFLDVKTLFWEGFIPTLLIPLVLSSFVENYILNTNRKLNENLATIESQSNLLFQDNQLKTKLLSILSHNLHSPTTSLGSILDLSNKATINPDEFNDLKLRIKGQLETTEHILDNTLNWIKH